MKHTVEYWNNQRESVGLPPLKDSRQRSITLPDNWDELRAQVRERDAVCVECGGPGQSTHHVNHNRTDNRLNNLILLCWSCHIKHHHKPEKIPFSLLAYDLTGG